MANFHEVQFPIDIALGALGGPERRTEIVSLRSGVEERNAVWANARRRWNAGYGVKQFPDLEKVLHFFEERRGRLYGFRWRDRFDYRSAFHGQILTPFDQTIGTGDGINRTFQLVKTYGANFAPYQRKIKKPCANSVMIGINNQAKTTGWTVNLQTGLVTFAIAPAQGQIVTAGFEFDTPARFDADKLSLNYDHTFAGTYPDIPIVEILIP